MESIEHDRINTLEHLIRKLSIQLGLMAKKMSKIVDEYEHIEVDAAHDIRSACKKYGNNEARYEQELQLVDIYAENTKNMMNRERRIASLSKWADWLSVDVSAQQKARSGLEKVRSFARNNPSFDANNDADVALRLESVQLLQVAFEASLFKVKASLDQLVDNNNTTSSTNTNTATHNSHAFPYASQLITTYDKQVTQRNTTHT